MPSTLKILKESGCALLASGIGLCYYRYLNRWQRLLLIQAISCLVVCFLAHVITYYQKMNHLKQNNHWIHNVYMPIEAGLLAWAAYLCFTKEKDKRLVLPLYAAFVVIYAALLVIFGISTFNNYAYVAGALLLAVLYLLLFYRTVAEKQRDLIRAPEVWVCLGVLLYFLCTIPYLSMINYLNENYLETSRHLNRFITEGLSGIRYLLLAIAFWLMQRNSKLALNNP